MDVLGNPVTDLSIKEVVVDYVPADSTILTVDTEQRDQIALTYGGECAAPGMLVGVYNLSTWEAEAGKFLLVCGQTTLHTKFQASQGCRGRAYFKSQSSKQTKDNSVPCYTEYDREITEEGGLGVSGIGCPLKYF